MKQGLILGTIVLAIIAIGLILYGLKVLDHGYDVYVDVLDGRPVYYGYDYPGFLNAVYDGELDYDEGGFSEYVSDNKSVAALEAEEAEEPYRKKATRLIVIGLVLVVVILGAWAIYKHD